jgi:hypothetical protein
MFAKSVANAAGLIGMLALVVSAVFDAALRQEFTAQGAGEGASRQTPSGIRTQSAAMN